MNKWLVLILLALALPLMGVSSKDTFGCSCGSATESVSSDEGVASSSSYTFDRSELGYRFEALTSTGGTYKANANLGRFLSVPKTASDTYEITLPLSRKVIIKSESE
ncbi:MAG: hypothetical protein HY543_02495 [Deltaproteobacteria bacterium]|nr:hypothetical protein [Deltaproteobacteria bacterium]